MSDVRAFWLTEEQVERINWAIGYARDYNGDPGVSELSWGDAVDDPGGVVGRAVCDRLAPICGNVAAGRAAYAALDAIGFPEDAS